MGTNEPLGCPGDTTSTSGVDRRAPVSLDDLARFVRYSVPLPKPKPIRVTQAQLDELTRTVPIDREPRRPFDYGGVEVILVEGA